MLSSSHRLKEILTLVFRLKLAKLPPNKLRASDQSQGITYLNSILLPTPAVSFQEKVKHSWSNVIFLNVIYLLLGKSMKRPKAVPLVHLNWQHSFSFNNIY